MKKKVAVVFGTRPEAIKMAPLVRALGESTQLEPVVIATAQHREMLDQVLQIFAIKPDYDLDLMRPNQTLSGLTSRLITSLDEVVKKIAPSAMLVQGDTTSVLAASLVSFYNNIPVGHVEAGLRTNDMRNPFPEEMNRVVTGRLAHWHFAPTQSSAQNLLDEQVPSDAVFMTGNTVIDALFDARQHADKVPLSVADGRKMLLVTTHRRENFGEPLDAHLGPRRVNRDQMGNRIQTVEKKVRIDLCSQSIELSGRSKCTSFANPSPIEKNLPPTLVEAGNN